MGELLASNPALGLIGLGFLTLISLVLTMRFLRWLLRIVSIGLPTPFLGEGSNMEWAQKTREEIASGIIGGVTVPQEFDLVGVVSGEGAATAGDDPGDGNGTQTGLDFVPRLDGPESEGAERELLTQWLNTTAQDKDGWAEKVLALRAPRTNK